MFKKAVRKRAKLKLAITGPSGSGKTLSSLYIAKGLGGKVAVIDTENGSASLYAGRSDVPEFDSFELTSPYTTQAYLKAINEAVKAGYDVLIIDSGSHQWAGDGGILTRKEQADQKPGSNSYTNWGRFTPEHEQFKSAILQMPIHLIMTLRSKQEYVLQQNEKGKQAPIKVGMAPVQRESFEYEFSSVLDVDMTHTAESSKDRTGLFDGQRFKITQETGEKLGAWLNTGTIQGEESNSPTVMTPHPERKLTADEFMKLRMFANRKGWSDEVFYAHVMASIGSINPEEIPFAAAKDIQGYILDAEVKAD